MTDRTGQRLGEYQLLRRIGDDGVATFYRGEQRYSEAEVTVKVFDAPVVGEQVQRFRDQARAQTNLFHEHMVRIYDFGVEGDVAFLITTPLSNGTLDERCPQGTRLPLERALEYVRQIAGALQYMHDQGLAHGDLRPAHLWIKRGESLLVGDFLLPALAQPDAGTADAYQAPELTPDMATPAGDQYALAVLVYTWLVGRPPVPTSVEQPIGVSLESAFPRGQAPTIPQAVEEAVKRALNPDPSLRFPSVRAFADGLGEPGAWASPATLADDSAPDRLDVGATDASRPATPRPVPDTPVRAATPLFYRSTKADEDYSNTAKTPMDSPKSNRGRDAGWKTVVVIASLVLSLCRLMSSCSAHSSNPTYSYYDQPTYPPPTTTLLTYHGHHTAVYSVAWSPDGKYLASGDLKGSVQVWEAASGHLITNFDTHNSLITGLAWSPDGKYLASGGQSGLISGGQSSIKVWEALTGTPLYTYAGEPEAVARLAWSPNGKYLAAGGVAHTVLVWDALTGQTRFSYTGHQANIHGIAWSPDSQYIASSSGSKDDNDNSVQVWQALTGKRLLTYTAHHDWVDAVAWSPDGKAIASGDARGSVDVWDATNGQRITTFEGHLNAVTALAWSSDSHRIASASFDETVRIWNALTGSAIYLYAGHSKRVWAVSWEPDGAKLASASEDETVQIWQLE